MENQIIYPINGKNYVLVSMPIASEYRRQQIVDRMKRHGGILHKGTPVSKFFGMSYVQTEILVPEENLYAFNMEGLN